MPKNYVNVSMSSLSAQAIREYAPYFDAPIRDTPRRMGMEIEHLRKLVVHWENAARVNAQALDACRTDRDAIDAERKAKVEALAEMGNLAYQQSQELARVREEIDRAALSLAEEKRTSDHLRNRIQFFEACIDADDNAGFLTRVGDLVTRHPWASLAVWAVISIVADVVSSIVWGG